MYLESAQITDAITKKKKIQLNVYKTLSRHLGIFRTHDIIRYYSMHLKSTSINKLMNKTALGFEIAKVCTGLYKIKSTVAQL